MTETGEKVSSPSSSSSYARKDLEFFKVFLPEFSSLELMIPQAFIDILEKPLPNQVLLVDEIGRLWGVETKTEDTEERVGVATLSKTTRVGVCLRKGWEKFANDQSLEFGDFLLFRYDGDSRLAVTIFAKDGCKKDLGVVTTADRSRVAATEKEPVVDKPVDISIKPERWEGYGRRVLPNRKRVSVKEEPGVPSEVEPEHRRNTRRKVDRPRDPCEMAWIPEKKPEVFEESDYKPKTPHFVRNITKGSLRVLEIPTTFLRANGIVLEEDGDMELRDENEKTWPLKIQRHGRGLRFSHDSWLCFCESHKLSRPNKCLFEFIVTSNGTCNQILVRIFRGSLLTTVTKSGYHVLAL